MTRSRAATASPGQASRLRDIRPAPAARPAHSVSRRCLADLLTPVKTPPRRLRSPRIAASSAAGDREGGAAGSKGAASNSAAGPAVDATGVEGLTTTPRPKQSVCIEPIRLAMPLRSGVSRALLGAAPGGGGVTPPPRPCLASPLPARESPRRALNVTFTDGGAAEPPPATTLAHAAWAMNTPPRPTTPVGLTVTLRRTPRRMSWAVREEVTQGRVPTPRKGRGVTHARRATLGTPKGKRIPQGNTSLFATLYNAIQYKPNQSQCQSHQIQTNTISSKSHTIPYNPIQSHTIPYNRVQQMSSNALS